MFICKHDMVSYSLQSMAHVTIARTAYSMQGFTLDQAVVIYIVHSHVRMQA
jgi:hypothetical protein